MSEFGGGFDEIPRHLLQSRDHLPYSQLQFFPKLAAFNIGWRERPRRRIDSFIAPRGCLTRPGMDNQAGDHSHYYSGFPALRRADSDVSRPPIPK